uniref:Ubiquitin fusion degradation protein 1 homolog n=1 Tax=Hirondellea gigas TaxID=1518452 RepID=A0A6A7G4I2_9CRUS
MFLVTLPAVSSAESFNSKNLEDGDKVLLPENILRDLMALGNMPHPLIFKITNLMSQSVCHCGVLEFSETQQRAVLPNWMFSNLNLEFGNSVSLSLAPLPKLTYVRFKPMSFKFSQILNPKASLEHALRKFTSLTLNDSIPIQTSSGSFKFLVAEIEPSVGDNPAGCIVDSDLKVEFDSPDGKDADAPPELLHLNTEIEGEVCANCYTYFKCKFPKHETTVTLSLIALTGDPDVYISTTTDKPTALNHERSAGSSRNMSIIWQRLETDSSQWYFIGVHAYKEPATFQLSISEVDSSDDESGKSTMSTIDHSDDPNFETCKNCGRFISKSSSFMHSMRCSRHNWRCPECDEVVRVSEKESHGHCPQCQKVIDPKDLQKHMDLIHSPTLCTCGMKVDPEALELHQEIECIMRLVDCKWCQSPFPLKELSEHERYCGGKTVECPLCNQSVARKKFQIHNAVVHSINPCVTSSGNRHSPTLQESTSSSPDIVPGYIQSSPDSEMISGQSPAMSEQQRLLEQTLQTSREELELREERMLEEALLQSMSFPSDEKIDIPEDEEELPFSWDSPENVLPAIGSNNLASHNSKFAPESELDESNDFGSDSDLDLDEYELEWPDDLAENSK